MLSRHPRPRFMLWQCSLQTSSSRPGFPRHAGGPFEGNAPHGSVPGLGIDRLWPQPARVAAISFSLAALYGAIYRVFPTMLDWKESANTWFTPYYFSIVTYTTLGFGDVRPATFMGEIIVSSEVIL